VLKFSKEESLKRILKRAFALVKNVNESSKATEKLLLLCHKKLVDNCLTRWSSRYLLIDRLLEVRTPLTQVLEELQWENLMTSEWRTLENLHLLLKPFAQYTSLVSGKEYTTISSIIPIVMKINLHLEEMKKVPELTAVSTRLQSELKLRFRRYTHPVPSNHEPVFLCPLSWILNLNYCSILLKQILLKPNSFVY